MISSTNDFQHTPGGLEFFWNSYLLLFRQLKFMYSEKDTKYAKSSPYSVAFSEYMNFNNGDENCSHNQLHGR